MTDPEHQIFQVGLKAFVRNEDRLLILRKTGDHGTSLWELPGGRIHAGEAETPLAQVLLREIREECGENFQITVRNVFTAWRTATRFQHPVFLVGFNCTYQSGSITLSDEHRDFAWVTEQDLGTYQFSEGFADVLRSYFRKR